MLCHRLRDLRHVGFVVAWFPSGPCNALIAESQSQGRTPLRRRKEITLKKWPDWRKINSGNSSGYGTTDLSFAWLVCCLQSLFSFSSSTSSTFGGYLAIKTLVFERTSLHQNTAYRIWTVAEMIKRPAQLKNKMSAKVFMCLPFNSEARREPNPTTTSPSTAASLGRQRATGSCGPRQRCRV